MNSANKSVPEKLEYVLQHYEDQIAYYWRASKSNKRSYKITRYLAIILGAMVTLMTSLASAEFITGSPNLSLTFAVSTPILAAALAIAGGFSQSFSWGPNWREMVLSAERLMRERDGIRVAGTEEQAERDIARLYEMVLSESEEFFNRILGGERGSTSS